MSQVDYFGFGQRSGNTGQQNFALIGRSCPQAVVDRRLLPGTVESVGDFVEPVLEQVAVGVHRHGPGGVPEHLLDDLPRAFIADLLTYRVSDRDHRLVDAATFVAPEPGGVLVGTDLAPGRAGDLDLR